jgi:hypothetical protein
MAEDMVQEGINAFKAGQKARARDILTEAVKQDSNNEQAWYYLAASHTKPEPRKQALEMVLKINPNNTKAREMLDKVNARLAEAGEEVVAAASPPTKSVPSSGAAFMNQGFKMPVEIPGAPERVTPKELFDAGWSLLRNSVGIFLKRPGAYEDEIQRATWWRFWLTVGTGSVVGGLLWAIGVLFLTLRFGFFDLTFLWTFIFSTLINLVAVYAGCYASHWYATKQAHGLASLVQHSHTMAAAWLPANVANAAVGAVILILFGAAFRLDILLSFGGLGGLGLGFLLAVVATVAVAVYTLTIQAKGVEVLYKFVGNHLWLTVGIMLAVTGLVYSILDNVLPG